MNIRPKLFFVSILVLVVIVIIVSNGTTQYFKHPYGKVASINTDRGGTVPVSILQIADIQISSMSASCEDAHFHPCGVSNTITFIEELLDEISPDLVVLSGDNVYSPSDAKTVIDAILRPMISRGIPFAWIFGNHDCEFTNTWDCKRMFKYVDERALVTGTGLINIVNNDMPIVDVWLFDYDYTLNRPEHSWTPLPKEHVDWYENESGQAPGLGFIHVPLPEITRSVIRSGRIYEDISSAHENTGLYEAMVRKGDMRVINFGHDHNNDFCGEILNESSPGPLMCYGGSVGFTTYGLAGHKRRARLFNIFNDGRISTVKYLDDMSVIDSHFI